MHLSGVDYKNAVRILIDTFEKDEVARETVAYADRIAEKRVEAIAKEPAVVPGPDNGRWPRAKAYLEEVRKIPAKLLQSLKDEGKVWADSLGNCIFPRAEGGAFVRGTSDKPF
ncbi:plasmid recombinant protein, partial [mine drainage metagenome]